MPRYNHATIEPKWQAFWDKNQTFAAPRMPKPGSKKLYVLDMFPYPSGDGLHVGHPEGYTATDIVCRAARMQGKSVMHPMGFDAFGLPAEEHAIKTGQHPRIADRKEHRQLPPAVEIARLLLRLGARTGHDRCRVLPLDAVDFPPNLRHVVRRRAAARPADQRIADSRRRAAARRRCSPPYQDEHRLAYQSEAPVNWCPALGTVLANEEVIDGKSEGGGHPVVRMPLRQWMLRITAYADRLEKDLEGLDWSEGIKALQRNWIGRSTGAEVDFFIGEQCREQCQVADANSRHGEIARRSQVGFPRKPDDDVLRIYTTRPDTLFGATYMVIAPEHPFVERLTTPEQRAAVKAYCEQAARKSDLDRTELAKEKTGVFTG